MKLIVLIFFAICISCKMQDELEIAFQNNGFSDKTDTLQVALFIDDKIFFNGDVINDSIDHSFKLITTDITKGKHTLKIISNNAVGVKADSVIFKYPDVRRIAITYYYEDFESLGIKYKFNESGYFKFLLIEK